MWADSARERAVYMLLQEKQLSDFSPVHVEFCRFSSGSKLNRSPQCRGSFSTDGAKIGIFSESCNICELFFFTLGGKIKAKGIKGRFSDPLWRTWVIFSLSRIKQKRRWRADPCGSPSATGSRAAARVASDGEKRLTLPSSLRDNVCTSATERRSSMPSSYSQETIRRATSCRSNYLIVSMLQYHFNIDTFSITY